MFSSSLGRIVNSIPGMKFQGYIASGKSAWFISRDPNNVSDTLHPSTKEEHAIIVISPQVPSQPMKVVINARNSEKSSEFQQRIKQCLIKIGMMLNSKDIVNRNQSQLIEYILRFIATSLWPSFSGSGGAGALLSGNLVHGQSPYSPGGGIGTSSAMGFALGTGIGASTTNPGFNNPSNFANANASESKQLQSPLTNAGQILPPIATAAADLISANTSDASNASGSNSTNSLNSVGGEHAATAREHSAKSDPDLLMLLQSRASSKSNESNRRRPLPFIALSNNIPIIAASMSNPLRWSLLPFQEDIVSPADNGNIDLDNQDKINENNNNPADQEPRGGGAQSASIIKNGRTSADLFNAGSGNLPELDINIPCPRPCGGVFGGANGILCIFSNAGNSIDELYNRKRPRNFKDFKEKKNIVNESTAVATNALKERSSSLIASMNHPLNSHFSIDDSISDMQRKDSGLNKHTKYSSLTQGSTRSAASESNMCIAKALDDLESGNASSNRSAYPNSQIPEIHWHDFSSGLHPLRTTLKSNNSSALSLSGDSESSRGSTPAVSTTHSHAGTFEFLDKAGSDNMFRIESPQSSSPQLHHHQFHHQFSQIGSSSARNRHGQSRLQASQSSSERDADPYSSMNAQHQWQLIQQQLQQHKFSGTVSLFQTPFPPNVKATKKMVLGRLSGRLGSSAVEHLLSICYRNAKWNHEIGHFDAANAWFMIGSLIGTVPVSGLNPQDHQSLNAIRKSSLDIERIPFMKDFLDGIFQYFISEGDVQTLAYLSCFIDDVEAIQKDHSMRNNNKSDWFDGARLLCRNARDNYRQVYSDLLLRWNCKMEHAEIQKYQRKIFGFQKRLSVSTIMEVSNDPPMLEISVKHARFQQPNPAKGHHCASLIFRCSICQTGVQGQILACSRCHHGGHPDHIHQWFKDGRNMCPTGCGCKCV